jgi:hypothetical protein
MCFVLTANVKIGDFKPVKPSSLNWKRDINDYSDTASIRLPAIAMLKTNGGTYAKVDTGLQMKEGMKIIIEAGYNGTNHVQFKGFLRRRNFTVPLELECEGYSYQLRKKEGYNKSYKQVTVKQLLSDLIAGTDIKLSDKIPNIPLKNIYFKNVKGTDVLDYLKEKCLLTVFFDFDVLYCGLQMTDFKSKVNYRLGWNVIKDNELKFEQDRELAKVNIQIEKRDKDGRKIKAHTEIKDGVTKNLSIRHIYDPALLKKIAEEERKKLVYRGYEGKITSFLFPYVEPSMAANITDTRYPERTGLYFIESVNGSVNQSGGRIKIGIGASLGS